HHALDHVSELADIVAGPVVGHQALQSVARDPLRSQAESLADPRQERIDERRNVRRPLAERRNPDDVHVQPEQEILAETPGRDSGSAALLRATKGALGLAPRRCRSRATSSLPEPLSPTTSTGLGMGANRAMASRSVRIAGLSPTSELSTSSRRRSDRISASSR